MSGLRDRCPSCSRRLIITRFDTTFRLPDRSERLCFGIPGGLCEDCHQLYIDPELIELLDLGDGRCVFAIESDVVKTGKTVCFVQSLVKANDVVVARANATFRVVPKREPVS